MAAPSILMSLGVAAADAGGAPSARCAIAAAAAAVPAGPACGISGPSTRGLAEQHAPGLLGGRGAGGDGRVDPGRRLVGAAGGGGGGGGPGPALALPVI